MGNTKTLNLTNLAKLYRNTQLRPLIAKYFITGRYRRKVILSKKRFSLGIQKQTNSCRNLLKKQIFDIFAFIQGGSNSRSFLKKSLSD